MTFVHQEDGIRWLLEREESGLQLGIQQPIYGGLLCDDMGMGKTKQLTQLIVRRTVPLTLIVAPVSVLGQWRDIIIASSPLSVYQCISRKQARQIRSNGKCDIALIPAPAIVLASYGQVMAPHANGQLSDPFPGTIWDRVILDEAQAIKNAKTLTCHSAQQLKMSSIGSRWAVTGTPVQNRLDDIYALFKFIGVSQQLLRKKNIGAAQWLFAQLALRRTVADLTPEQIAIIHFPEAFVSTDCDIVYGSEEEEEFYRRATGNIMHQLAKLANYKNQQLAARCRLELINQLRFLAVHPNIYINAVNKQRPDNDKWARWDGTVSKNVNVMQLINRLRTEGASFILFTHFIEEMRIYKAAIEAIGYKVYEVHGGQTAIQREHEIALSRNTGCVTRDQITTILEDYVPSDIAWHIAEMATPLQAMLIHIRAGGAGLNLQHFANVIIPSPDWNPAAEAQAIGRCHRIGQQKRVRVWRFYIREVQGAIEQIEVYMRTRQEEKKAIAAAVVDPILSPEANAAGVKMVRMTAGRGKKSTPSWIVRLDEL